MKNILIITLAILVSFSSFGRGRTVSRTTLQKTKAVGELYKKSVEKNKSLETIFGELRASEKSYFIGKLSEANLSIRGLEKVLKNTNERTRESVLEVLAFSFESGTTKRELTEASREYLRALEKVEFGESPKLNAEVVLEAIKTWEKVEIRELAKLFHEISKGSSATLEQVLRELEVGEYEIDLIKNYCS